MWAGIKITMFLASETYVYRKVKQSLFASHLKKEGIQMTYALQRN